MPVRLRVNGPFGHLLVKADSVRDAFAEAVRLICRQSKAFADWYCGEAMAATSSPQL